MSLCLPPPNLTLFGKDLREERGRNIAYMYIYSKTIKNRLTSSTCTQVVSLYVIFSHMSAVKPLLMAPLEGGHLLLGDSLHVYVAVITYL